MTCPKQAANAGSTMNCGHRLDTSGVTNGTPFYTAQTAAPVFFAGVAAVKKAKLQFIDLIHELIQDVVSGQLFDGLAVDEQHMSYTMIAGAVVFSSEVLC